MQSMSKKIDKALRDLQKALGKHAEVASDSHAGRGKLQKASAKVRTAAAAYGSIVSARTGADSPFSEIPDPRLDEPTVESLKAERDAMRKRTGDARSSDDETPSAETVASLTAERDAMKAHQESVAL